MMHLQNQQAEMNQAPLQMEPFCPDAFVAKGQQQESPQEQHDHPIQIMHGSSHDPMQQFRPHQQQPQLLSQQLQQQQAPLLLQQPQQQQSQPQPEQQRSQQQMPSGQLITEATSSRQMTPINQEAVSQSNRPDSSLQQQLSQEWPAEKEKESAVEDGHSASGTRETSPGRHAVEFMMQAETPAVPVPASRSDTSGRFSRMSNDSSEREREQGMDDDENNEIFLAYQQRRAKRQQKVRPNAQHFVSSPAATGQSGVEGSEFHQGKFDMASLYQGKLRTDRSCMVVDFATGKIQFSNVQCDQLFSSLTPLPQREVVDIVIPADRHNFWMIMLYMGIGKFSVLEKQQYSIITGDGPRPAIICGEKLVGPLWWIDCELVQEEAAPAMPEETEGQDLTREAEWLPKWDP